MNISILPEYNSQVASTSYDLPRASLPSTALAVRAAHAFETQRRRREENIARVFPEMKEIMAALTKFVLHTPFDVVLTACTRLGSSAALSLVSPIRRAPHSPSMKLKFSANVDSYSKRKQQFMFEVTVKPLPDTSERDQESAPSSATELVSPRVRECAREANQQYGSLELESDKTATFRPIHVE